jgi:nicotinamide mononucleotide (NMN) deamidase PncC
MKSPDLLKLCREKKVILATVESCTGGMLAAHITDISGVSEIFWGSWSTYDNSAKISLGVPPSTIQQHGAVSPEVAIAMAEAGLENLERSLKSAPSESINLLKYESILVISTTGIAGPTGGTPEKPVGLCHLGIAQKRKRLTTKSISIRYQAPIQSTRADTRKLFTERAVLAIYETLSR